MKSKEFKTKIYSHAHSLILSLSGGVDPSLCAGEASKELQRSHDTLLPEGTMCDICGTEMLPCLFLRFVSAVSMLMGLL